MQGIRRRIWRINVEISSFPGEQKERKCMNYLDKSNILTDKENKFIQEYLAHGNATQAIVEAGYKTKQPSRYASDVLRKEKVQREIHRQQEILKQNARIASATEVLQFYTSVMRGEILDQFGIEASLDTRIKAANELAKHQIELPMKLESKQNSNQIGSIQLNFLPRPSENKEES